MITIKIGGPQATVELNARKALDGSLLIMDHSKIDIAVMPDQLKVVTFPKTTSTEDVYDYQNRLFEFLADKGLVERDTIQGGNVFRSLEGTLMKSEQINPLQAAVYVISEFLAYEQRHQKVGEDYEKELEDMYTHPDQQDSTEYGEVPQYAEKGSMRPGYYYYPLRNRY